MEEKLKLRSEVSEKFKWKIQDIISSDKEFEDRLKSLKGEFSKIDEFKQNLKIDNLLDCLKQRDKISQETMLLYVYANLRLNEDSTNNFYQAIASYAEALITEYQEKTAFIEPTILSFKEYEVLEEIEKENMQVYSHYIKDLLRSKKHILSQDKEELLAKFYEVGQAPDNIFSMLNNADLTFEDIKDSNDKDFSLTHGRYTSYLESKDRVLRKNAFKSYYTSYYNLKNTISTTYISSVKNDVVNAKIRNYNSSLEMALSSINVPISVYRTLIKTVSNNINLMHRYVRLRKKLLGLDNLHFYDLYTPMVKDVKTKMSFEDAKDTIKKALSPLGEDYIKNLQSGFDNGWIDVYENVGKRSGAYAWGAYGTHPFVSLNYDDTINSMFTLAHEMGHALHSYYTWQTQPYIYSSYTIFVAEVASTVNEALLMEYLLKTTTDKTQKLYLLNYYMEQFRGTLFRQTMFAEFEMLVHDSISNNKAQTFESLCELYKNLNIKYYGSDIELDKEITWEWMRIPHFYNSFYVYQYATGYSCAIALSQKILKDNNADKYINFLKSGSSNYSIDLLKLSGVDITKTVTVVNAMKVFESLLTEMEELTK